MATAKVTVTLEIEFDETQYQDGILVTPAVVKENFDEEFKPEIGRESGFDMEYYITKAQVEVSDFVPSVNIK